MEWLTDICPKLSPITKEAWRDSCIFSHLLACHSASHNYSDPPGRIIFGCKPRLPVMRFGAKPGEKNTGDDYVSNPRNRMEESHQQVRLDIQNASDRTTPTLKEVSISLVI